MFINFTNGKWIFASKKQIGKEIYMRRENNMQQSVTQDELIGACIRNELETIKSLVSKGRNLKKAMEAACYWGKHEIVKYLVEEEGVKIHEEALEIAMKYGQMEVVKYLKKRMLLEKMRGI